MLIKRGRTEQTQDSQVVRVEPTVLVDLADTALLQDAGQAVLIDVTAACPVGATGQQSYVNVSQGQASGNGLYLPTCDGQRHTFTVSVQTSQALFQPGARVVHRVMSRPGEVSPPGPRPRAHPIASPPAYPARRKCR